MESTIGLYKTELIDRHRFTGRAGLEHTTAEWVHWYNTHRSSCTSGVRYTLPLLLIVALLTATAGAKTFLDTAEHADDLPAWLFSVARDVFLGRHPLGRYLLPGVGEGRSRRA